MQRSSENRIVTPHIFRGVALKKCPIKILSADPVMRDLVAAHDPPRIGKNPVFFSLVRAVISQQLSETVASTIFKRLSAIVEITPSALIALDAEIIRGCGISSSKVGYIKGISQAALDGALDNVDSLPDDEAIKALVKLKGVGRWTAEMILIFSLGREDCMCESACNIDPHLGVIGVQN